jgi:DNA-binding response OmpR family regulator
MLRRGSGGATDAELYRFGDVQLDFRSHQGEKGGRPLAMSALEFEAMRYLIRRRGDVVSREQLLKDIWGYQSSPTTRSVDNLMARLRHKLEDRPHAPRHILTIHGVGYKFAD